VLPVTTCSVNARWRSVQESARRRVGDGRVDKYARWRKCLPTAVCPCAQQRFSQVAAAAHP